MSKEILNPQFNWENYLFFNLLYSILKYCKTTWEQLESHALEHKELPNENANVFIKKQISPHFLCVEDF